MSQHSSIEGSSYTCLKRGAADDGGDVSLFVWRKQAKAQLNSKRPPVLLVHGSSMSALPTYDLSVPGLSDYSFMDWLALRGYDVWTLDHEGYGRSTVTKNNSDIACGADDLEVTSRFILNETRHQMLNVYGLSSGALRAALFATRFPDRISKLVLDGFVWTGKDSPTLAKRKENIAFFQENARRPISHEFISSIFTRDMPGTTDPAVATACASAELAYGSSVPTGSYLDMTTKLPLVDPTTLKVSTLIVRGEHDGIATAIDQLNFFEKIESSCKQFSILPDLAHVTPLGIHRKVLWNTVKNFFEADLAIE
jgi:pimeloyl-ACP methyl ester carboxylesterase